jgi:hypothetical protein
MKLADEAVEKIAEVLVHLGEAAIIGGVGLIVIESGKWYWGVGGIFIGVGLIVYGVFLIHNLKSRSN